MKKRFLLLPVALVIAFVLALVATTSVLAWPNSWEPQEKTCDCASARSTIEIGTWYKSGSHWYYLDDVLGDGVCVPYNSNGKATGTLTFVWKRVGTGTEYRENKTWEISRPGLCTDCRNTIDGTPTVSDWTYSQDGLTRSKTITTPTYDADWPQKSCGVRTETIEEKASKYCFENKTGWYFPGEVPQGAVEGQCTACQVVNDVIPLPDFGEPVYSEDGHTRVYTREISLTDPDGNPCGSRTDTKTEYATPYCVNDETIWVWPNETAPDADPGVCPTDVEGEPDYELACVKLEDGSTGIKLTLILPEGVVMYDTPGGTIYETTSFIVAAGSYDFAWDTEKGYEEGSGILHVDAKSCEKKRVNWKPKCDVYPCPPCLYENTRGTGVDCLGPDLYGTQETKPAIARVIEYCIAKEICTESGWWVVAWAEGEKGLDGIHDGDPNGLYFKTETNQVAWDGNTWKFLMNKVSIDGKGAQLPNTMSYNDRFFPVVDEKTLTEADDFYMYEPCSLSLSYAMTMVQDGKNYILKMPGTDQWSYATFLIKAGKAPMPNNWADWKTGVLGEINQWYIEEVMPAKVRDWIEVPDFNQ